MRQDSNACGDDNHRANRSIQELHSSCLVNLNHHHGKRHSRQEKAEPQKMLLFLNLLSIANGMQRHDFFVEPTK